MVLKDRQSHIPWSVFKTSILKLIDSAENLESEKIQLVLKQILPTYTPLNFNNSIQEENNLPRVSIKAEA